MEKPLGLLLGEVPEFLEEFLRRGWNNLGLYPALASIAIVKEFYANAKKIHDEDPFLSYVRGRRVPFDVETINTFLGTDWSLGNTLCQYAQLVNAGVDYREIEQILCIPEGTFELNKNQQPIKILRSNLTSRSKMWLTLIHANMTPCSHVSDITMSRSIILYAILTGRSLNVGRLIANEIHQCAHAAKPKVPLGHPCLITHLCELAGVDTSTPPFERPHAPIDKGYYTQHCLPVEGGDLLHHHHHHHSILANNWLHLPLMHGR